jgi:hypothetical protein
MMTIVFSDDGTTMAYSEDGERNFEIERSWICLYFDFLAERGIDLSKVKFEMPHGRTIKAKNYDNEYTWWNQVL